MATKNVFIVGSGNVAKVCIAILMQENLGDSDQLNLTIYNPNINHAKGVILDAKSNLLSNFTSCKKNQSNMQLNYTNNITDLANADLLVVMAGQYPTMKEMAAAQHNNTTRELMSIVNYPFIEELSAVVNKYNSNVFVIMVTNQVDYFTKKFQQLAKHDPKKIVGFGGVVDSNRFRTCLKEELEKYFKVSSIRGHMIGYHNKDMFPLSRSIRVNDYSLEALISRGMVTQTQLEESIDKATNATRIYGQNIFELNKNNITPFVDTGIMIAKAILNLCFKRPTVFIGSFTVYMLEHSVAARYYRVKDTFLSVPVLLQPGNRINYVYKWPLTAKENEKMLLATRNFEETFKRTDRLLSLVYEDKAVQNFIPIRARL